MATENDNALLDPNSESNALLHFVPSGEVRADLRPTVSSVTKFVGTYVDLAGKTVDWQALKKAMDAYPGTDITFDFYKNTTIAQSEATVETMVDKITQYLTSVLSIAVSADRAKELRTTISNTFTNLKDLSKTKTWLKYTNKGGNSSWEYRLLYCVPDADPNSEFFNTLATTIELIANIDQERSWFGLYAHDKRNFSATINAMELVVKKGFPSQPLFQTKPGEGATANPPV